MNSSARISIAFRAIQGCVAARPSDFQGHNPDRLAGLGCASELALFRTASRNEWPAVIEIPVIALLINWASKLHWAGNVIRDRGPRRHGVAKAKRDPASWTGCP